MNSFKRVIKNKAVLFAIPLIIFLFSLVLRIYFFTGFILGDDVEDFQAFQYIISIGPNLQNQLHIRFGLWIFDVLSFKLFGQSEFSFFLPTVLMSSSLSVIGYYLLTFWKYPRNQAFLASLLIASAPFEVLLGVVHANDLILGWVLAIAFYFFITLEKKPIIQGTIVASLLWFAFYIKIWAVYFYPVILIYYLYKYSRGRQWKGFASFLIASLSFHVGMMIIWQITTRTFIPFVYHTPATYPVDATTMPWLLQVYPKMILFGSEFGTTFFGVIPYILLTSLLIKTPLSTMKAQKIRFDKFDFYLIALYLSFFLLLNFFPNTFKFDQYYSAPRIFRYLAPISFPMTLHVAKNILDLSKIKIKYKGIFHFNNSKFNKYSIVGLFIVLICLNIYQADNATKVGQIYHSTLVSIIKDIRNNPPPGVLSESWLDFFLREVYLKGTNVSTLSPSYPIDTAQKYERWIQDIQPTLENGSMLISGIGSYTFYGCHNCGIRLNQFNTPLDPGWKLVKEYQNQSYLPIPESAKLWVWSPP
jgi:hypothetical protein